MNERAPYPTPEQPGEGDFSGIPTPEEDNETYHLPPHESKKGLSRKKRMFAGITAAVVIGGGTFVGHNVLADNHDNDPSHGKRPAATGPATPNPQETSTSVASPEVASSAEAMSWNEGSIPLLMDTNGDGKMETYTGVEQAAKALEITVANYPNADDAAKELIHRLNQMMSWGSNQQALNMYKNYKTQDGLLEGETAVAGDFVYKAYKTALTSLPPAEQMNESDKMANDWMVDLYDFLIDTTRYYETSTTPPYSNGTPYGMEIELVKTHFKPSETEAGIMEGPITFIYDDNLQETGLSSPAISSVFDKKSGGGTWHTSLKVVDGRWVVEGIDGTLSQTSTLFGD